MGTSSVRTLVFDGQARPRTGFGVQLPYRVTATPDGGVEVDGDHLLEMSLQVLTAVHDHLQQAGLRAAAISFSAFWHSFLGIDAQGVPTTPIVHLFDTRSAAEVEELKRRLDPVGVHARTGAVLHTSYWPAKLLWLYNARRDAFDRTSRWVSFGEYLFLKLFGAASLSSSMASGTGLWNQNRNQWDETTLAALPVRKDQLTPASELDQVRCALLPEWKKKWPLFDGIPWLPAYGDGACNNIGSGCITKDRFSLMVGTSGAMRAVIEAESVDVPAGVWCYRVDASRFVLGGALSNGGEVFAWMRRVLVLPAPEVLEQELAAMEPGAHGLTILPLFAGERSPKWRGDARAAFTGMSMATGPVEITRAALESVALRFRQIYTIMAARLGEPVEVVASGGALAHSPAWTQMMADALGRPVLFCAEEEASSRGAALLALEHIGAIANISELPAQMGRRFVPRDAYTPVYDQMLAKQLRLYTKLFEEN